jgi:hypothetical protein
MQENLKNLKEKFQICGRLYEDETKIVNQRSNKTDLKSFVKLPSELDAFMDDIEFIKVAKTDIVKSYEEQK